MNIVTLKPALPLPEDASERLREMADRIDRGEITALVLAAEAEGEYELHFPSSPAKSIVLITLLHARCVDKFRA